MAYNRRNLLNKMVKIQDIVAEKFALGIPYTRIYKDHVRDQFDISYSTFNNYLYHNARAELKELERKEAERRKTSEQLTIQF